MIGSKRLTAILVCCLLLSSCSNKDDDLLEELKNKSSSQQIESSQSSVSEEQIQSSSIAQPQNLFDEIESESSSKVSSNSFEESKMEEQERNEFEKVVNSKQSEREQALDLIEFWKSNIPGITVDLFKSKPEELLSKLEGQFPMGLRYIWGKPKIQMEPVIGGFQDMWVCSSADGSFSGQLKVMYNSTDEVEAEIVSVTPEVIVDKNNLIGVTESKQSKSKLDLKAISENLQDETVDIDYYSSLFEGVSYEDLVIEWGKPDHKDAENYQCWDTSNGFVCVLFDSEGKFNSCKYVLKEGNSDESLN